MEKNPNPRIVTIYFLKNPFFPDSDKLMRETVREILTLTFEKSGHIDINEKTNKTKDSNKI